MALLASPVQAQGPARVVSGIVFDSVARARLRGAVVQLALIDTTRSEAAPRVFAGVTDADGRYRIADLPAGRYAIGFQHESLNALGLEPPVRAFELHDDSVAVDLAIPGGAAVRAMLCVGEARMPGEGMLVGYVAGARDEGLLRGAVVRVRWLELALERLNYRAVTRMVTAITGEDGRYLACGVTSDDAVAVEVAMPGHRVITHRLAVPAGGVARQDYRLVDSAAVGGEASVAGRVLLPDGRPLPAGHVVIDALGLEAAIRDGEFAIAGIPAGTWVVEARAIGYEPYAALVDASPRSRIATISLSERPRVLEAITVKGKRGGDEKILRAIAGRRSTSVGTVFLPGNAYLESSYDPADALRTAPGFRYVSAEVLLSSGCGFRYPPPDAPSLPSGVVRARTRTLAVYLDGARVAGGLPELRTAVTMRDILAMEAYQDVATAPLEWRTNDACSVLAIWTKR